MADLNETFVGTTAVREQHRFDEARSSVSARDIPGSGPIERRAVQGRPVESDLPAHAGVEALRLRRKPPGKLLPSAHAVDREYKVMTALGQHGFPGAEDVRAVRRRNVIGTAFFVMDCVEGAIFWDQSLPGCRDAERAAIYDEMNRVIALLHSTDYNAIGSPTTGSRQLLSRARSSAGPTSAAHRRPRRSWRMDN
jgi:hypothetical protein